MKKKKKKKKKKLKKKLLFNIYIYIYFSININIFINLFKKDIRYNNNNYKTNDIIYIIYFYLNICVYILKQNLSNYYL